METKTQQDATTTQDDATQEMDELNARLKQLKEQQKEAQKLATELRKRKAQQRKDNKAEKASSHILRAYLALYFANKSEDDARDELTELVQELSGEALELYATRKAERIEKRKIRRANKKAQQQDS